MSQDDLTGMRWIKSSYSGGNGNCVEVAFTLGGVAARDSKEPQGAALVFDRQRWSAFLRRIAG